MKGWKECPDCWGTGFVRGFGAPCGKKKPVEDDYFFGVENTKCQVEITYYNRDLLKKIFADP